MDERTEIEALKEKLLAAENRIKQLEHELIIALHAANRKSRK